MAWSCWSCCQGALGIVLDVNNQDTVIELAAGQAFLVPRETWHRQLVREPGDLLFITPGPNTAHRGVREHAALRGAQSSMPQPGAKIH
jgi:mannose-6-phosphate isomerase-like protein (cupin superfamily)